MNKIHILIKYNLICKRTKKLIYSQSIKTNYFININFIPTISANLN